MEARRRRTQAGGLAHAHAHVLVRAGNSAFSRSRAPARTRVSAILRSRACRSDDDGSEERQRDLDLDVNDVRETGLRQDGRLAGRGTTRTRERRVVLRNESGKMSHCSSVRRAQLRRKQSEHRPPEVCVRV